MAGWLAGNLRIITVTAVACFSYYGADYWSSRNKHESIEKTNSEEYQESDGVEEIVLGVAKPAIARSYFTKINSGIGGKVVGTDKKIEEMEKDCKDRPQYNLRNPNLNIRRYCRLYGGIDDGINILIETKDELMLLSSSVDEGVGKTGGAKYTSSNQPGGNIATIANEQVPQEFKNLCEVKSKESVYDENNDKYKQVVNYCTRKKTIKDELNKRGVKLLAKDSNTKEGDDKLKEYNSTDIGERFKSNKKISSVLELQKECEETVKLEKGVLGYINLRSTVIRYCSINNPQ